MEINVVEKIDDFVKANHVSVRFLTKADVISQSEDYQ